MRGDCIARCGSRRRAAASRRRRRRHARRDSRAGAHRDRRGAEHARRSPSSASIREAQRDRDRVGRHAAAPARAVALRRAQHGPPRRSVRPAHDRRDPARGADEAVRVASATHALAIGALGAAVLDRDRHAISRRTSFPRARVPVAAGAAGDAASWSRWPARSRSGIRRAGMPKRRLKLPRPAAITAVGGSDRVVWMTTQQDPSRIDVIPLVNRGQPKAHDLPEPIAADRGAPAQRSARVRRRDSGRLYVVDLDGRAGLRVDRTAGHRRASRRRRSSSAGPWACSPRRRTTPVAFVSLDGRRAT